MASTHEIRVFKFDILIDGKSESYTLRACGNHFSEEEVWLYKLHDRFRFQSELQDAFGKQFKDSSMSRINQSLASVRAKVREHNSRTRPQFTADSFRPPETPGGIMRRKKSVSIPKNTRVPITPTDPKARKRRPYKRKNSKISLDYDYEGGSPIPPRQKRPYNMSKRSKASSIASSTGSKAVSRGSAPPTFVPRGKFRLSSPSNGFTSYRAKAKGGRGHFTASANTIEGKAESRRLQFVYGYGYESGEGEGDDAIFEIDEGGEGVSGISGNNGQPSPHPYQYGASDDVLTSPNVRRSKRSGHRVQYDDYFEDFSDLEDFEEEGEGEGNADTDLDMLRTTTPTYSGNGDGIVPTPKSLQNHQLWRMPYEELWSPVKDHNHGSNINARLSLGHSLVGNTNTSGLPTSFSVPTRLAHMGSSGSTSKSVPHDVVATNRNHTDGQPSNPTKKHHYGYLPIIQEERERERGHDDDGKGKVGEKEKKNSNSSDRDNINTNMNINILTQPQSQSQTGTSSVASTPVHLGKLPELEAQFQIWRRSGGAVPKPLLATVTSTASAAASAQLNVNVNGNSGGGRGGAGTSLSVTASSSSEYGVPVVSVSTDGNGNSNSNSNPDTGLGVQDGLVDGHGISTDPFVVPAVLIPCAPMKKVKEKEKERKETRLKVVAGSEGSTSDRDADDDGDGASIAHSLPLPWQLPSSFTGEDPPAISSIGPYPILGWVKLRPTTAAASATASGGSSNSNSDSIVVSLDSPAAMDGDGSGDAATPNSADTDTEDSGNRKKEKEKDMDKKRSSLPPLAPKTAQDDAGAATGDQKLEVAAEAVDSQPMIQPMPFVPMHQSQYALQQQQQQMFMFQQAQAQGYPPPFIQADAHMQHIQQMQMIGLHPFIPSGVHPPPPPPPPPTAGQPQSAFSVNMGVGVDTVPQTLEGVGAVGVRSVLHPLRSLLTVAGMLREDSTVKAVQ